MPRGEGGWWSRFRADSGRLRRRDRGRARRGGQASVPARREARGGDGLAGKAAGRAACGPACGGGRGSGRGRTRDDGGGGEGGVCGRATQRERRGGARKARGGAGTCSCTTCARVGQVSGPDGALIGALSGGGASPQQGRGRAFRPGTAAADWWLGRRSRRPPGHGTQPRLSRTRPRARTHPPTQRPAFQRRAGHNSHGGKALVPRRAPPNAAWARCPLFGPSFWNHLTGICEWIGRRLVRARLSPPPFPYPLPLVARLFSSAAVDSRALPIRARPL